MAVLDIAAMSDLELKGIILAIVGKADNRSQLERFVTALQAVSDDEEWWNEIPQAQQKRILESYKESYNSDNWIDHEDVKKQHSKWLQK